MKTELVCVKNLGNVKPFAYTLIPQSKCITFGKIQLSIYQTGRHTQKAKPVQGFRLQKQTHICLLQH